MLQHHKQTERRLKMRLNTTHHKFMTRHQRLLPRVVILLFISFTLPISHIRFIKLTQAADTVNHMTCGSVIKLENDSKPKVRLHSHDIKYGSGSGQQSVTAQENQDTNSYWSILGNKDKSCNRGEPIECGSIVRLQHVQTRKYLHSHLFTSPLSNKQEVSAFGGDGESDSGDHWMVYCKSRYWLKDESIRLKHVDTGLWLSLSGNVYGRPIFGQLEVVCSAKSDTSSYWRAAEGVYVQPTLKAQKPGSEHDEL